ncbi:CDGSH iron-sulfur domain-containing protein [Streptomyces sp. NPDC090022]|uniref:CDGSH iron-sulfur domain-containing protein n=1 Tax=Streptomyces sp. NPDC090022 TaxID=3365920 RepID=UPI0037FFA4B2
MPSTSEGTPRPGRIPQGPGAPAPRARRVAVDRSGPPGPCGPVLVEGPVEMVLDDGTTVRSDRFMVAVCTCRRSRTYPWCDTSHRPRERATPAAEDGNEP